MVVILRWFSLCVCLAMLAACGGPVEPGTYRAVLTLPGGELPFGLQLANEDGKPVAYLINGKERVRVPDVEIDGRKLRMTMPAFGNRLTARNGRDGLEGELVMVRRGGEEQVIPFRATAATTHRFFESPSTDNADVSGRWAVTFTGQDGKQQPGIGEFSQRFHEVEGTFLTLTGDHRFLAGEMRGDELYLSAFDGGHAYLYHARVLKDGSLTGKFWSGLHSVEQFVARRDADAKLADPAAATTIRDDTWTLGFTFADQAGNAVSMADPQFDGKVVLIVFAGSWCPNCHDEAAFLATLYREYRERGLEIIALMYEHFGDFEKAAAAVQGMRAKFGIEYATLIAGISDKESASERFPQLSGIRAFPTTLFMDRRGRVRRIYTGFSGPATGEHHVRLKQTFVEQINELLAEERRPAGGAASDAANDKNGRNE
jgi:thiol-disulfide isomerase/thioredoxin